MIKDKEKITIRGISGMVEEIWVDSVMSIL